MQVTPRGLKSGFPLWLEDVEKSILKVDPSQT